jgi:hypothetical protein
VPFVVAEAARTGEDAHGLNMDLSGAKCDALSR